MLLESICQDRSIWLVTYGSKLPGELLLYEIYTQLTASLGFVRSIVTWVLETVRGDKMFAAVMRDARAKPMHEYLQFVHRRDNFISRFYKEVRLFRLSYQPSDMSDGRFGMSTISTVSLRQCKAFHSYPTGEPFLL